MPTKTPLLWATLALHLLCLTHHSLTATSLSGNPLIGAINLFSSLLFSFTHHTHASSSIALPTLLLVMQAVGWGLTTYMDVVLQRGWFFGVHAFGDALAEHAVLGVPMGVLIGMYPVMYASTGVTNLLLLPGKRTSRKASRVITALASAAIDTLIFTAYDLCIDPLGPADGMWKWDRSAFVHGAYFGVPVKNYYGWLIVNFPTFFVVRLLGGVGRARGGWVFEAAPVVAYAMNAVWLCRIAPFEELRLVTVGVMGVPVVVALANLVLARWEEDERIGLGKKNR
ncbi:uncharacterized protein EV422DRAFT_569952 [Fimicolochytrium jonesii]|uniref:uncharacterized protein n=1 Tax=Fimicolochytrium jonesii TaxID=1396493 RepID=UPI0022FEC05D|nr:uncharacterized protein EV422DRAFT_569952 [Fimicolochytrium jonesii]KAI8818169.1 hypothetical protein EV422DRAFT_569952 [Fimicolochytrium jonesii]